MNDAPRVMFYLRTDAEDQPGKYDYDYVDVRVHSSRRMQDVWPNPPLVGDLVYLNAVGSVRIIERDWTRSTYGSPDWPLGQLDPTSGPMLQLVCVKDEGPFRDEAERPETDE